MTRGASSSNDRGPLGRLAHVLPRGPSLTLAALLLVTLFMGGASRADAMGQVIVRGATCLALLMVTLVHQRPVERRIGAVGLFIGAMILLVGLQLIPLPMSVWSALPGREPFVQAVPGEVVWRPLAIVPGAAVNSLLSLMVPLTIWLLARRLDEDGHGRQPGFLLGLISVSAFLGIVQFSGSGMDNPFINETLDMISGSFANRNHFALFLAIGCAVVPYWVFLKGRRPSWRAPVGCGLVLLFFLMILASGSRAGIILGVLASACGAFVAWTGRDRGRAPLSRGRVALAAVAAIGIVAALVTVSIQADRARSVTRAMTLQVDEDMRVRAAPLVVDMTRSYFPAGAGFGGFDPLFRTRETFDLLKSTYFNRAHDDLLEVVLEGGVAAFTLLVAAIVWLGLATWRAWRRPVSRRVIQGRLGSLVLLLILLSSIVDYPARTPMMMAIVVLASVWLQRASTEATQSALPGQQAHL